VAGEEAANANANLTEEEGETAAAAAAAIVDLRRRCPAIVDHLRRRICRRRCRRRRRRWRTGRFLPFLPWNIIAETAETEMETVAATGGTETRPETETCIVTTETWIVTVAEPPGVGTVGIVDGIVGIVDTGEMRGTTAAVGGIGGSAAAAEAARGATGGTVGRCTLNQVDP
jgi:hypothetical protein